MSPDQIAASHRSRVAYVYIRQSTEYQVQHNVESTQRQRRLHERALQLGWLPERVVVVDEDLGHSAARSEVRVGFERMVAEAALGHVGIILALEVSRLCRGNRDWYHLLDICAVSGTLIGDGDGLYDPRAYNDRLLLGLKGTMSEAELHLIKQRLVEAVRSKARRGEFRYRLPAGYVWDEAGRMRKEADEQVRSTLESIFQRFRELGTAHAVYTSLAEDELRVPVLFGPRRALRWVMPGENYVRRVLTNPLYAGAYVYGKRQVEEVLDAQQRPVKRIRERPRDEWHVLIRDHHEGYVTWEEFERIQRQITANRRGVGTGAAREGSALLQGLVLCGRCGRRMKLSYFHRHGLIRYACVSARQQTGAPVCQSLGGLRLERAVERLVVESLQPLGVEAMIEAAAAHARAGEAERTRWVQEVERARYEVDLARRQYEAVDPANRLVARELEGRWEQALHAFEAVEKKVAAQCSAAGGALTSQEQDRLRDCARDVGRLWHAPETRAQDKKRVIRCLVENVVVRVDGERSVLVGEVHWAGGEMTAVEVPQGKTGQHRYVTDPELVELIRSLAPQLSDEQIARVLFRKRLRTAKGLSFTGVRVTQLRRIHGIEGTRRTALATDETYTAENAAEILGVTLSTVIRWVQAGLLRGSQPTSGAPWRIEVTQDDRRRLMASDAPAGWLPLKGAANALGISQQTVLERLQRGELEGIRVQVGRRAGWRIRPIETERASEASLFDESAGEDE